MNYHFFVRCLHYVSVFTLRKLVKVNYIKEMLSDTIFAKRCEYNTECRRCFYNDLIENDDFEMFSDNKLDKKHCFAESRTSNCVARKWWDNQAPTLVIRFEPLPISGINELTKYDDEFCIKAIDTPNRLRFVKYIIKETKCQESNANCTWIRIYFLKRAVKKQNVEAFYWIYNLTTKVVSPFMYNYYTVLYAVEYNMCELLTKTFGGIAIQTMNTISQQLFDYACKRANVQTLEYILTNYKHISITLSSFVYAASNAQVEVCKWMVKKGFIQFVENKSFIDMFFVAISNNNCMYKKKERLREILQFLEEQGCVIPMSKGSLIYHLVQKINN